MKYHVLHIAAAFAEEWQADVFHQQLFDLGCDTIDGEQAYIPSELWDTNKEEIESLCADTEGVVLLDATACPDENWNAVWESEHPVQELPLGIHIVPHCAFGAGHHETTSMMINGLLGHAPLAAHPASFTVLDHGTGTGVLAVFAKRLGATGVMAVDIDEKSVENALENAALNGETIDVLLSGHLAALAGRRYDLILANIHRNVLLANMPAYAQLLAPRGELWLSGFYEADYPALVAAAQAEHLRHLDTYAAGDWRMLTFALQ